MPAAINQPRLLVILTAVALAAAGCGKPPVQEQPPPATAPTTATTPPTTPPTTPTSGQEVTVTGTVVAGVEPGCLLLDTDAGQYLLLNGDRTKLEPDRRLTVSGIARPGTPTTCMQGIPLDITEIQAA